MTIMNLGTASRALRRSHGVGGPRREARAAAFLYAPLAYRGPGASHPGATGVLDLALSLILASAVALLLTLAL